MFRNFAVIALLAAVVAFAPAGGRAFDTFMVALSLGFLAVIAIAIAGFAARNELTLASLTDQQRLLLYAALGVLVLLIAGTGRFFASGPGTLAWIVLLVAALFAIVRVWRQANTY